MGACNGAMKHEIQKEVHWLPNEKFIDIRFL